MATHRHLYMYTYILGADTRCFKYKTPVRVWPNSIEFTEMFIHFAVGENFSISLILLMNHLKSIDKNKLFIHVICNWNYIGYPFFGNKKLTFYLTFSHLND